MSGGRDRDPMDVTRPPPTGWRCEAHDDMMRSLGRVEAGVDGLNASLDVLRVETRSGFADVKNTLAAAADRRTSDTRQLASRVGKVEAWKIGLGAVVALLMFAIPTTLTIVGWVLTR